MKVQPAPQLAIAPETIRKQSRRHCPRLRHNVQPDILAGLAPMSSLYASK